MIHGKGSQLAIDTKKDLILAKKFLIKIYSNIIEKFIIHTLL